MTMNEQNPSSSLDPPSQGEDGDLAASALPAATVYLLMTGEYRISRNRRAEWYFNHLNSVVAIPSPEYLKQLDQSEVDLEIVSIVPTSPPANWNPDTSYTFRYKVTCETVVIFLSRKYRIVYCLDVSPSAASVDVQAGIVMLDGMFEALKNSTSGLMLPFYVPGSRFLFRPKIYISVIAHGSFLASTVEQVIVQGILLEERTYEDAMQMIFEKLHAVENSVAEVTTYLHETSGTDKGVSEPKGWEGDDNSALASAMSPDFGLVDLLRQALIALNLLPQESTAGLIIVTDGVINVPDGGYLDMVLSQFRYNTVACSFIQLSSPFHPHVTYGSVAYVDLLRFIAVATCGAYLTIVPRIGSESSQCEINPYHEAFLEWSFQKSTKPKKSNPFAPNEVKPGEWSVRNKCFSSVRDMPIVRKLQSEDTLVADFKKIISSRLREGFIIKEIIPAATIDNQIQIVMSLDWKFLINIEYAITTTLQTPAQAQGQPKLPTTCAIAVSIEGPYDFIHDVTCLAKTQHPSYYRQLLVSGFWSTLKQLSESDKLLAHFDQFTTSPAHYTIPESLKKGLPLFSISTKSHTPTKSPSLQPNDFAPPQLASFWRAVCSLDRSIWEKWMHTHNHQIQFILSPDTHFEHKHLHIPNSSGRYHVIQCRQTLMALNTLLKDWCSFVLVENHSYIRLMSHDNDKPPFSFCITRITTKPPCVVLRIAFLVGTPGQLRNQTVKALKDRIARITFPQRLNEPPKWRMLKSADGGEEQSPRALRKTWSDMPASIVLETPIEKMLIRYEIMPKNFFRTLLPQHHYNTWTSATRKSKTNQQSTFGFNPTYSTPWGPTLHMGPEMFNTMARYFYHRRWIWCVQNPSLSTPTLDCAALILSTITKMRLQEGLRFAFSSGGAINMVKELKMKITEDEDNNRPYSNDDICSCVLQYVIFPPVSSLCNADDDDDEGSLEEEDSEMYLITECWVEPQYGKVLAASENVEFENLTYWEIPAQIFQIDQECISTLLTFEHLSLMCQNADPVTPKSEPTKVKTDGEDQIKYIPFNFEVSRILPRSRQAELLFSMFNQNLQLNFRNGSRARIHADRANVILFNAWISSVTDLHDREVILEPSENKRIFQLITGRKRDSSRVSYNNPINVALAADTEDYPKWRCFTKWVSSSHIIVTLFPASYGDLMSLMLPPNNEVTGSVAVNVLNDFVCEPCEGNGQSQGQLDVLAMPSALGSRNSTADTTPNHSVAVLSSAMEPRSAGQFWPRSDTHNYFFPASSAEKSLRKRLRVKSGGELSHLDGPSPGKKSLIRKSSLDNLFLVKNFCAAELPTRRKTASGPSRQYDIEGQGQGQGELDPDEENQTERENLEESSSSNDIYGSVTLPVYVFDCSLSALHDHIIFRNSGQGQGQGNSCCEDDIYTDCRFSISTCKNKDEMESGDPTIPISPWGTNAKNLTRMLSISPKHKSQSPEPKPDESDLPPSNKEILRRHCGALEASFSKSYVLGLFESLQRNQFIQPHDVQIAISLCEETKVSVDLSEFIEALCSHVKDAKQQEKKIANATEILEENQPKSDPLSLSFINYETCANLEKIQEFIKDKFQEIILSTFQSVTECPGIYFFKFDSNDLKFINRSNAATAGKDISSTRFVFSSSNLNADSISSSQFFPRPEPQPRTDDLMETSGEQELYDAFVYTTDEPNSPVESENDAPGPAPEPVLLYLTCVYKGQGQDSTNVSFLVHQIPTCIEEIVEALENQGPGQGSGSFSICKSKVELKIEFVFLTVPKFKERINYEISSVKSKSETENLISPPPQVEVEVATTEEILPVPASVDALTSDSQNQQGQANSDESSDVYPSVPWNQLHCIEKTIQDVRWLIQDEITCFSSEKIPIEEQTLAAVISHVEQSVDKPGCQLIRIPLLFVDNSQPHLGFEKFKERFQGLRAYGYELKEKGSLYYLINQKDTLMECLGRISTSRAQMVEAQASDVFDTEELEMTDSVSMSMSASQVPTPSRKISGQESNARLRGKQTSGDPTSVDSLSMSMSAGQCALTTSCQQSERSSIITNEDGYEGDGSESERESVGLGLGPREVRSKSRSRNVASTKYKCPTFWMIFKLTSEQINVYFQCRCNENEMDVFDNSTWICQRIVKLIHSLKRIVNQDLLLQQLHDKRFCSELLEPDDEEDDDFMEGYSSRPELPLYTGPTPVYPNNWMQQDRNGNGNDEFANFSPGSFSCRVVGEFRLFLHPRLRIGPGKSLMSRGIQTIKATLIAFEISNRRNMFVYRDGKGNDFYLRLYRLESRGGVKLSSPTKSDEQLDTFGVNAKENETMDEFRLRRGSVSERELAHTHRQNDRDGNTNEDTVEDIVLLQVCGITEAGQEIKENLVQSLQNKLDDSVLDILSVMLDRNPHCKLTPEDVHFIQKPKTPADTIIKYHVNDYGQTNLSAFNYYLNQNLLQFSGIPRYMDFKPENHFQDYPPVLGISENEIPGRNIHLYNQSPGETGSRGIACIAVNIVNSVGAKVMCSTWARPNSAAHEQAITMEPNVMDNFYSLIQAKEVENENSGSKVMVEFRVWKQGRISIDLLKGNLSSAIKNTMWDLVMEFSFLTAPIAFDPSAQEKSVTENLEIPVQLQQYSYSASRFNKFETGEAGHLHPILANSMRDWSEFGNRLNVPSLRIVPIPLPYRQPVDLICPDLEKLICSVLHENMTKIFWKEGDKGNGHSHFTSSALTAFSEDKRLEKRKLRSHFFELDDNSKNLDGFEDLNEIDYPADLMGIFQDAELFDPASRGHESIIVSRHLRSWRACVHGSMTEGFTFCPEEKSLYKFPPLLAGGSHAHSHSPRELSTPRGSLKSEGPLIPGVGFPILVPRQRLLMVTVTNSQISFMFYNWSKESSLRLIEITKNYTQWISARTAVACSIFAQKSGLFYNQPIDRPSVDNPFTCGGMEVETLLGNTMPIKEQQMQNVHPQASRVNFRTNRTKSPKLLAQFLESFRNVQHQSTVLRIPGVINNNAKFLHGQVLQLKSLDRTELENTLIQNWGTPVSPRASNSPRDTYMSLEAVEAFKKAARRVHFCLTPILFLKRWRIEVATTRDGTIGTIKKGQGRHMSDSKRSSQRNLKSDGGEERSRHGSGASEKSFEVGSIGNKKARSSIWGIFSNFNSQNDNSGGKGSSGGENMAPGGNSRDGSQEKWHSVLLENFVEEYMQYLQILGFNRINLKNSASTAGIGMRRGLQGQDQRLRNMSGTSLMSTASSQSAGSQSQSLSSSVATTQSQGQGQGQQRIGSSRDLPSMVMGVGVAITEKVYYLQKVLPGGVILLDLSFSDPFFYVNIYALEIERIQGQGQTRKMQEEIKESDYKNALMFLEESDKVKDSMHLHSFAFDFHLRSAQSYICGRQLLPSGFHLTHFFDDFIKYYPKHPNFARNTVHTGNITVQNIATPSHILYDYILTHKMLYNMKVVQINSSVDKELNEYILVQSSTKKIIYKDVEDEKQSDEFDLSLLVAHDAPVPHYSADPSVLRLKYYIVLTSRQELYPKLEDEGNKGKFGTVNLQNSICQPKRLNFAKYQTNPGALEPGGPGSAANSRRGSVEDQEGQGQFPGGSEPEDTADPAQQNLEQEVRDMGNDHPFAGKAFYDGIREEKVHYMGYFSSHEQMMQEILQEQVLFVESSLLEIVEMAAVDCRRDLLWQRLLVGGKFNPAATSAAGDKSKRDDLIARETVGPLTIWDFRELLSFLHVKSLSIMDQRVASLLKQPISFYQSLLKLITVGNLHSHRYFVAPDNSIHQMAIFTPSVSRSVVMLEINLEKRTSDLSVIFKELNTSEEPIVLEPEILNLIESVINACCYCSWANMV